MFTGIVQQVGRVKRVEPKSDTTTLWIASDYSNLEDGESIAVNGVCLTVESSVKGDFQVTMSRETLSLTTLGRLNPGDRVNLERALRPTDRLGGHIVSGHVDCTARLLRRTDLGETTIMRFELPSSIERFVATKGSIAINGVSLTVNKVEHGAFEVMLIPFTLEHTNLGLLKVSDQVNIEVDMVARYVFRWVEPYTDQRLKDLL